MRWHSAAIVQELRLSGRSEVRRRADLMNARWGWLSLSRLGGEDVDRNEDDLLVWLGHSLLSRAKLCWVIGCRLVDVSLCCVASGLLMIGEYLSTSRIDYLRLSPTHFWRHHAS